ncbi:MAG: hypothetical protein IPO77_17020 [Acidobacteria bacterium]|nr:hypothetical protein [Acidobacteriota bacterium]
MATTDSQVRPLDEFTCSPTTRAAALAMTAAPANSEWPSANAKTPSTCATGCNGSGCEKAQAVARAARAKATIGTGDLDGDLATATAEEASRANA